MQNDCESISLNICGNLSSRKIDMGFVASIICSRILAGSVGSLSLPSPLLPAAASNAAPFVAGTALQTLLARLVQVGKDMGR